MSEITSRHRDIALQAEQEAWKRQAEAHDQEVKAWAKTMKVVDANDSEVSLILLQGVLEMVCINKIITEHMKVLYALLNAKDAEKIVEFSESMVEVSNTYLDFKELTSTFKITNADIEKAEDLEFEDEAFQYHSEYASAHAEYAREFSGYFYGNSSIVSKSGPLFGKKKLAKIWDEAGGAWNEVADAWNEAMRAWDRAITKRKLEGEINN